MNEAQIGLLGVVSSFTSLSQDLSREKANLKTLIFRKIFEILTKFVFKSMVFNVLNSRKKISIADTKNSTETHYIYVTEFYTQAPSTKTKQLTYPHYLQRKNRPNNWIFVNFQYGEWSLEYYSICLS